MLHFRLGYLTPVIALLRGLSDPIVNLSMGQTAENIAYRFQITRTEMDAFALESHRRVAYAQDNHLLKDVIPTFTNKGEYTVRDDGVRRDTTLEKTREFKTFF